MEVRCELWMRDRTDAGEQWRPHDEGRSEPEERRHQRDHGAIERCRAGEASQQCAEQYECREDGADRENYRRGIDRRGHSAAGSVRGFDADANAIPHDEPDHEKRHEREIDERHARTRPLDRRDRRIPKPDDSRTLSQTGACDVERIAAWPRPSASSAAISSANSSP
jgi:hypothetical protein